MGFGWVMSKNTLEHRQEAACRLAIVVPCYNEEDVLPLSLPALLTKMADMMSAGQCTKDSYILLIDE